MHLVQTAAAIAVAISLAIGAAAQEQGTIDSGQPTAQLVLSPDGKIALTAADETLMIWDTASGRLIRTLRLASGIASFSFAPDGLRVVVIDRDNRRRLWETGAGRLVIDE